MHAREFEAMVLTDFSEFFSRIALVQAQIIDPENAGLAFRIGLGSAVGCCRKLVFKEWRDREHVQLFTFGKCYQPQLAEVFFHALGGGPVNFDERGLRCPRSSSFIDQLSSRFLAVFFCRFAEKEFLTLDLAFPFGARFRQ